ncbi:hypothetical protein ACSRUE_30545 [Sorangium sp. KYC3313]|uniref:hypothetical protein n=1 Tax=Sorangium sp. KYC3313 TaxID=3449740 RepID=UPI003F8AC770
MTFRPVRPDRAAALARWRAGEPGAGALTTLTIRRAAKRMIREQYGVSLAGQGMSC